VIVAAIATAIVGGFYLGGPGPGMAVGALCAAAIVVIALRASPRGAIVPAPLHDLRCHILLIASSPLEDPRTLADIAALCESSNPQLPASEVRLLVPVHAGFLERWSCERRPNRALAERGCVLSLASLAKVGLSAQASVGDADVVLAVEDELRTFPATDVVLITAGGDGGEGERIAAELRERLEPDFVHLDVCDRTQRPVASPWRRQRDQPLPRNRECGPDEGGRHHRPSDR
jgi:hypothetical protein